MKCVMYPEVEGGGKVSWGWRFETESGAVIAKSARSFEDLAKCERELRDVMASAAKSKIITKKLETTSEKIFNRIRTTLGGA